MYYITHLLFRHFICPNKNYYKRTKSLQDNKGLFGFWYFYHSSLKNGGAHGEKICLVVFSGFVSITQLSDF